LGVGDGGVDLGPVADDAGVGQEALAVVVGIGGDADGIEPVEGGPEILPLMEDGAPGEAGLKVVQEEELEKGAVIVDGDAPFPSADGSW